ncbi:MAG: AraC family transcriptional regulator, partial [Eubacteriales bacterium]|nr:AraC family transcriptional regulator [Eubacteriales bacterium]
RSLTGVDIMAIDDNESLYSFQNAENSIVHHSYRQEQAVMDMVKSGNPEVGKLFDKIYGEFPSGKIAINDFKQAEYASVLAVSFAARAAIDGGMIPSEAYNLNDLYLQKISAVTKKEDFMIIMKEAFTAFSNRMQIIREKNAGNIHIRRAKEYIYKHINKKFEEKEIAEHVGLSPSYLSALFMKETGMGIKEFTNRERISISKNLLRFSDYSIEKIAYYLCFNSQSHFTSMFKKYTGQTPGAFRTENFRD